MAAIHVTVGDLGLEGTIEPCRGIQRCLPKDSGFRAASFLNEGVALTLTPRPELGVASLREGERLARAPVTTVALLQAAIGHKDDAHITLGTARRAPRPTPAGAQNSIGRFRSFARW